MYADSLHRLTKILLDNGEASSVQEAVDRFSKYGVTIRIGKQVEQDEALQIIALTAVNVAARCFVGHVALVGESPRLAVRGFEGTTLAEFLLRLGANPNQPASDAWPTIQIGGEEIIRGSISPWACGWLFGLGDRQTTGTAFAPACVAAAGLAVSEAFSKLREDNPYACRRRVTLSLWNPGTQDQGPAELAPLRGAWLVGLGNLGQAYAWTMGFLQPTLEHCLLQDIDSVSSANLSTSMLNVETDVGQPKARVVSRWLERRGFKTRLVERRFVESQRVGSGEPTIALFGVDNAAARRVVEAAGFELVVDAGLGGGFRDFRSLRIRTFPGPSRSADLWPTQPGAASDDLPVAYKTLLRAGAERCGVTMLATRAVGAPFVGCVAAAYVVAEVTRRQAGGLKIGYLDMSLRDPERFDLHSTHSNLSAAGW